MHLIRCDATVYPLTMTDTTSWTNLNIGFIRRITGAFNYEFKFDV